MWRSKDWFYKTLEQARAGEEDGRLAFWIYLYAQLPSRIRPIVRARGVAHDDIEDAVHDVVVCLISAIRRLRDPAAFDAYAFRIMQHVSRRYRQRHFLPLDEQTTQSAIENDDMQLDIAALLAELPSGLAQIVNTVYLQKHSYKETAALSGCSTRAIKRMLQKARNRMRTRLAASFRINCLKDFQQQGSKPAGPLSY